jgi:hypothetical protein
VGFKVLELRRTRIGPVTDRGLKTGKWRELEADEIEALLAGETAPKDPRGPRGALHRGHRGRKPERRRR